MRKRAFEAKASSRVARDQRYSCSSAPSRRLRHRDGQDTRAMRSTSRRSIDAVFPASGFTTRMLAFTLVGVLAMNREQRRAAKSRGKAIPGRAASVGPAGSSVQIAERFAVALSHHQAGRLVEAEGLYRQICAVDPQHVDSLHFLVVLAGQVGRSDIAIDLIGRALALRPDYAEALCNMGNILAKENRLDQAAEHYKRALALNPNLA